MKILRNVMVLNAKGVECARKRIGRAFERVIITDDGTATFEYPSSADDGSVRAFRLRNATWKKEWFSKMVIVRNGESTYYLYPATQEEINKELFNDRVARATIVVQKYIGDDVRYLAPEAIIAMAEGRK